MKIAFVGAVEGSAIALRSLITAGAPPGLVLTLPPERAGNHSDFSDLRPLAVQSGSEIVYVSDINGPTALHTLRAYAPDLVLVIGWSQICKSEFRSIAGIGNIGFHPALLPRLRGRGVIPWTILLGERETGASLFWLDDNVDSGPILLQERIDVAADETARSLYTKQTDALSRLLPEAIYLVRAGNPPKIAQDESRAVYCAKRTPDDGAIDWKQPRDSILRLVRAVGDPYPGAFTKSAGRRLVIEQASAFDQSHRYIGLSGQVQSHTPAGFTVRCGDGNCIHVTGWKLDGRADRPRLHEKFEAAL
jgi:methionyl-tRNA formyltransferase